VYTIPENQASQSLAGSKTAVSQRACHPPRNYTPPADLQRRTWAPARATVSVPLSAAAAARPQRAGFEARPPQ